MTIDIRKIVIPVLVLYLVYLAQLRWNEYDTEAFNRMFDARLYGGLLVDRFIGRYFFLAIAVGFLVTFAREIGRLPWQILLVAVVATASLAWTNDMTATVNLVLETWTFAVLTIVVARYLSPREIISTVWWFGLVVIALSVALALIGDPHALMSGVHQGRWRGLFNHKNQLASFACLFLLLSAFAGPLLRVRPWMKGVNIALCLACLAMAQSSTPLVVLPFAGLLGWVTGYRGVRESSNRLVLYIAGGVATLIVGFLALGVADSLASLAGRDLTLTGRTGLWGAAFPFTLEPLGTGFGTMGGEQVIAAMRSSTGWEFANTVHNSYIQMALDVGWLATGCFVYWLLTQLVSIRPATPGDGRALLTALAACHVALGMTEVAYGIYPSLSLFMALGTFLIAHGQRSQPERSALQESNPWPQHLKMH